MFMIPADPFWSRRVVVLLACVALTTSALPDSENINADHGTSSSVVRRVNNAARRGRHAKVVRPQEPNGVHPLGYRYTLPAAARARSVIHAPSHCALAPLLARLEGGLPVSIGVMGSSVAQQGGCLEQPGQRCMGYDGFATRLLRFIQTRWPHSGHSLVNVAVDMTPLSPHQLPCLYSHLPRNVSLVLLDFASMAGHSRKNRNLVSDMETVVRALLSGPPLHPLLVLLSVYQVCRRVPGSQGEMLRYEGPASYKTP